MKKTILLISIVALMLGIAIYSYAAIQDCQVVNNTGYTINYLYVTADYEDWDDVDILGSSVLRTGQSFEVNFDNWNYGDHCIFDFKAIDEDGDTYYKWGVDLCSVYTVTFTLSDLE